MAGLVQYPMPVRQSGRLVVGYEAVGTVAVGFCVSIATKDGNCAAPSTSNRSRRSRVAHRGPLVAQGESARPRSARVSRALSCPRSGQTGLLRRAR